MQNIEKAVLLSALLFPGSGHIFLKCYRVGTALIITALVASYFLIYGVIHQALVLADKIIYGEIQPDLSTILALVSHQSTSAELQSVNAETMVLLVVWLVGLVDIYRVGRNQYRRAITEY